MDRSPTTGPVSDRQRSCPPKAATAHPDGPHLTVADKQVALAKSRHDSCGTRMKDLAGFSQVHASGRSRGCPCAEWFHPSGG